jgi:ribosomal protein S4E
MNTYGAIFQSLNIDLEQTNDIIHKQHYGTSQYFIKLNEGINEAFINWCNKNNITNIDTFKSLLHNHYISNHWQFNNTRLNVLFTGKTSG